MSKIARTVLPCTLLWLLSQSAFAACPAESVPFIVAKDGPVTATYRGSTATYSNDLYLSSPPGVYPGVIFNNKTSAVGSKVRLGTFRAGTELVFRIHVNDTGRDFYSGDGSRNPDGLVHTRILSDDKSTLINFEDVLGLPECTTNPERTYHDLSFAFTNLQAQWPLDDFVKYATRPLKKPKKIKTVVTSLAGELGSGSYTVGIRKSLASPADANLADIADPNMSLEGYAIVSAPQQQSHTISVSNTLGDLDLTTVAPDELLVPSSVSRGGPPKAPSVETHNVDRMLCYTVQVVQGAAGLPAGLTVPLVDRLTKKSKLYAAEAPSRFCAPVEKDSKAIRNAGAYLMCYSVTPGTHKKLNSVLTRNELGAGKVRTLPQGGEICLSSTATVN